jgi:hypothetical protein
MARAGPVPEDLPASAATGDARASVSTAQAAHPISGVGPAIAKLRGRTS